MGGGQAAEESQPARHALGWQRLGRQGHPRLHSGGSPAVPGRLGGKLPRVDGIQGDQEERALLHIWVSAAWTRRGKNRGDTSKNQDLGDQEKYRLPKE